MLAFALSMAACAESTSPGTDGGSADGGADAAGHVPPDAADGSVGDADADVPGDGGAGQDSGEAGSDPGDAGSDAGNEPGPPRIVLLAPTRRAVEVYRALRVALHARCEPDRRATVQSLRWNVDGTELGAVEADELRVEHTFEQPGSHEAEVVCSDNLGASTRTQLSIVVERDPPYLVYHDGLELRAARVDQLDQSVGIEPAERPLVPPPVHDFRYARGGKAVVTIARIERNDLEQAFAIYLDDLAQPKRFELVRSELAGRPFAFSLDVSPDGRHVFVHEQGQRPRIYRLEDAGPVLVAAPELAPFAVVSGRVVFAADGRHVLYNWGGPLQLFDLDTSATVTLAQAPPGFDPRYWQGARFVDDGKQVVYLHTDENGSLHVHVIALDVAFAGGTASEIAVVPASLSAAGDSPIAALREDTQRTLMVVTDVDIVNGPTITVLDLTGNVLATYREPELQSLCGDRALLRTAGGLEVDATLELVQHVPAVTSTLLAVHAGDGPAHWSRDCRTVATSRGGNVEYFELPADGLPTTAPTVHTVAGHSVWSIRESAAGNWVFTMGTHGGASVLQLNRDGVAVAHVPAAADMWLVPDGSSAIWHLPDPNPSEPNKVLQRTLLLGASAGSSAPLYGPFELRLLPTQLSPDSHSLLLEAARILGPTGELLGDGGLVRIDLDAPTGPNTGPLLPYVNGHGFSRVQPERLAGRRALLLRMSGELPLLASFYARSLEDGAETVAQALGGPAHERTERTALSADGSAFAVQNRLGEQRRIAVAKIRLRASDPVELSSQPASDDERLLGFGTDAGELLLSRGTLDDAFGPDMLARYDLVAAQSRVVAETASESVRITDVQRLPRGRVFFKVQDSAADTCVLYLDEPGNAAPRALSPLDRCVTSLSIAPDGDWLAFHLQQDPSKPEPVHVLDGRRDWQGTAVSCDASRADWTIWPIALTSGEHPQLLLSCGNSGAAIRVLDRDALDAPRDVEVATTLHYSFVSPDQSRLVTLNARPSGKPGTDLAVLDLRDPTAVLETRASLSTRSEDVIALSPSGRYALLRQANGGRALFVDLDGGAVHELPARLYAVSFDRLERYLVVMGGADVETCDVHVVDLAALDQPPQVITRACSGGDPLWVD